EDEALSEQMTDYVQYLLDADGNSWFTTLHDAVHDGLLKRVGIIKWWWDIRKTVTEQTYTGLDPVSEAQLSSEPDIEILERIETAATGEPGGEGMAPPVAAAGLPAAPGGAPAEVPGIPPAGAPQPGMPLDPFSVLVDLRVRRTTRRGVLRMMPVPPEEFILARDARDVQTATYCAHRSMERVSDLVAKGAGDLETLADHATSDTDFSLNDEATQRNPPRGLPSDQPSHDKSSWRVLYVEHFIRFDGDGDGIAELHRVCTAGDDCDLLISDEVVSEVPMAIGSPIREPHRAIGSSVADQTLDLQDLKTGILRGVMDSLAESIDPKLGVVESQVNLDDVTNNERGAIIRMKQPGAVQPLAMPFVGAAALPVLAYVDDIKAQRTGVTRASQGLDPEVLQSTTKAAVQSTIEGSQERVEMIARTLADTLVRQVFRGVLRALVQHQDRPRMVRLRGAWVQIDPRYWDTEMDISVNVALGRGPGSQRMQFLMLMLQQQQQILTTIGPDNPLVTIRQFRATLAEIAHLGGYRDADRFFLNPTAQDEARFKAQAQQAKAQGVQDPGAALAQAQAQAAQIQAQAKMQATMIDAQVKQDSQRLEAWKAQAADDRERERLDAEIMLRAAEIQAKYGAQVDTAAIRAAVDRDRHAMSAAVQARGQDVQAQQPQPQGPMQ
ncbi:MAG TPA: hypothetical protein VGM87_13975, partial [Roseomonas sp.]